MLRDARPLSHLLLDLHPALLLLLLLDFQLLKILLLTLFDGSRRGRSRRPLPARAALRGRGDRSRRLHERPPVGPRGSGGRGGVGSSAAVVGAPPTLPVPL